GLGGAGDGVAGGYGEGAGCGARLPRIGVFDVGLVGRDDLVAAARHRGEGRERAADRVASTARDGDPGELRRLHGVPAGPEPAHVAPPLALAPPTSYRTAIAIATG